MLQGMNPAQRAQMAAAMGLSPQQLAQVRVVLCHASLISSFGAISQAGIPRLCTFDLTSTVVPRWHVQIKFEANTDKPWSHVFVVDQMICHSFLPPADAPR